MKTKQEIINCCDGFCYTKKHFHRNKENKVCPKCQKALDICEGKE